MCDWDEGEYAEYLRWVEAAATPARVRAHEPARTTKLTTVVPDSEPPLAAET